jgi:hypothetical protein
MSVILDAVALVVVELVQIVEQGVAVDHLRPSSSCLFLTNLMPVVLSNLPRLLTRYRPCLPPLVTLNQRPLHPLPHQAQEKPPRLILPPFPLLPLSPQFPIVRLRMPYLPRQALPMRRQPQLSHYLFLPL